MTMTEFSEGDLIEATKGDTSHKGRLERDPSSPEDLFIPLVDKSIALMVEDGFTLTLIEKAAPALPTVYGTVIAGQINHPVGDLPSGWRHMILLHADEWRTPSGAWVNPAAIANWEVISEPIPVTAKRVLDAVREEILHCDREQYSGLSTRNHLRELIQDIATEFGVSDA